LVPLAVLALGAGLWPYVGSPFAPMIAVLVFCAEPAFADLLFRSDHDLEAVALLPVAWDDVVLARNLSTLISSATVFLVLCTAVVFAAPAPMEPWRLVEAILWWGTIALPLLHIGNEISVRTPRRVTGWTFEDVAEAGVFLAIGAVLAVVHPLLAAVTGGPIGSVLFLFAAGAFWRFRSIPSAAARIRDTLSTLSTTS